MCVQRLVYACLPFLITGLLSCSGGGGWPITRTDPCSLLTAAEVEQALGEPVQTAEKTSDSTCVFTATQNPQNEVTIQVDEAPGKDRKSWFNKERMRSDRALIAGLGDGAVRIESPPSLVRLTFLRGDALVTVMVSSMTLPNRTDAVTQLAKAAADRVGSQSLIARVADPVLSPPTVKSSSPLSSSALTPSSIAVSPASAIQTSRAVPLTSTGPTKSSSIKPDHVVGTWYARSTTGLTTINQMLVIDAKYNWTLSSTIQLGGSLDTESGMWSLERSSTRTQKAWQGTYKTNREDAFSTTGSIAAQWARVPPGHNPSRVPVELWQIRRDDNEARVTQLKSVDPALVGLWEATGIYKGGKAEFVWSIKQTTTTNILIMESTRGAVETKDGIVRLMPARNTRRGMAIVALHGKSFTTSDGKITIRWNQEPPRPSQTREL